MVLAPRQASWQSEYQGWVVKVVKLECINLDTNSIKCPRENNNNNNKNQSPEPWTSVAYLSTLPAVNRIHPWATKSNSPYFVHVDLPRYDHDQNHLISRSLHFNGLRAAVTCHRIYLSSWREGSIPDINELASGPVPPSPSTKPPPVQADSFPPLIRPSEYHIYD